MTEQRSLSPEELDDFLRDTYDQDANYYAEEGTMDYFELAFGLVRDHETERRLGCIAFLIQPVSTANSEPGDDPPEGAEVEHVEECGGLGPDDDAFWDE